MKIELWYVDSAGTQRPMRCTGRWAIIDNMLHIETKTWWKNPSSRFMSERDIREVVNIGSSGVTATVRTQETRWTVLSFQSVVLTGRWYVSPGDLLWLEVRYPYLPFTNRFIDADDFVDLETCNSQI
jgi:hypothetical protein